MNLATLDGPTPSTPAPTEPIERKAERTARLVGEFYALPQEVLDDIEEERLEREREEMDR